MPSSTFPSELKGRRISKIDQLGKYKALEWKLMINYVAVITFVEIIDKNKNIKNLGKNWKKKEKQFLNLFHGIAGVMLLCLDCVSEEHLNYADTLIQFWFEGRENLWNDNPWLPKAHMMTHFHGPLKFMFSWRISNGNGS